jgi:uncharacterized protein YecE (DUF72 family)
VTATKSSVPGLYVGASGWSYPTWRPDFYPAGTKPNEFLGSYAERLPSVELNSTGYRIPAEEQFRRWAEQTPDTFRFAVKMQAYQLRQAATFEERVQLLGERLGPIRILVTQARDEGFLTFALGSLDPALKIAFDFRHESWAGIELPKNAVRINDVEARAPFRYLRYREPPYTDKALKRFADDVRPLVASGIEVFAYFRHEDEPTAPRYAERLLELLA